MFIGGKYLHQLGEVMEKVKAAGVAVRMGAPYAVFLMRSVNTVNLDPAIFEGPKYPPKLNENWKRLTGPNGNFTGPRHGQYVSPVLVIYLSHSVPECGFEVLK